MLQDDDDNADVVGSIFAQQREIRRSSFPHRRREPPQRIDPSLFNLFPRTQLSVGRPHYIKKKKKPSTPKSWMGGPFQLGSGALRIKLFSFLFHLPRMLLLSPWSGKVLPVIQLPPADANGSHLKRLRPTRQKGFSSGRQVRLSREFLRRRRRRNLAILINLTSARRRQAGAHKVVPWVNWKKKNIFHHGPVTSEEQIAPPGWSPGHPSERKLECLFSLVLCNQGKKKKKANHHLECNFLLVFSITTVTCC